MGLPEVLKKLNEIDVKDLQNIDYKAVLISVKKNPLPVIDAVIIIVALIGGFFLYSSRSDKIEEASREVADMRARVQEYKTYQDVKEKYDAYVAVLPIATEESQLVKRITSVAGRYDIKILSFPPPAIVNHALYSEWKFTLDVTSQEFVKLWQFLLDLEAMEETLLMTKCSLDKGADAGKARLRSRRGRREVTQQTGEQELSANIGLVYVAYKKD